MVLWICPYDVHHGWCITVRISPESRVAMDILLLLSFELSRDIV